MALHLIALRKSFHPTEFVSALLSHRVIFILFGGSFLFPRCALKALFSSMGGTSSEETKISSASFRTEEQWNSVSCSPSL